MSEDNNINYQLICNPFEEEEKSYIFSIDPKEYEFYSFLSDETSLGPIATFIKNINEKENQINKNNEKEEYICIKKLDKPYETCSRARRVLKIMTILSDLKHDNIVQLKEIYIPKVENYDSAYLFLENFPCNLEHMINSDYDYLKEEKIIPWIIYQILKGLYYLHKRGVIHRNIKPANILIDQNCLVKICGFGKVIFSDEYESTFRGEINDFISEKMCLNYLAPEALSSKKKSKEEYNEKIDLWGLGCILAELLTKKSPFFSPLKISKNKWEAMLHGVFRKMGKPDNKTLAKFASKERIKNIMKFKNYPKMDIKDLYPNVGDKDAIDLVEKLLCINPQDRITILEAKDHPFFNKIKDWKKEDDFTVKEEKITFRYTKDIEKMRKDGEFYDKQLDYYKKNIWCFKGKYNKKEIILNNTYGYNIYNYNDESTREATY